MTLTPHRQDPALVSMTLDILGHVLGQADNPGALAKYLCDEFRELTGARCVTFIQCLEAGAEPAHRVLSANPARRRAWAESPEAQALYSAIHVMKEARIWREGDPEEIAQILRREGFSLSLTVPLCVGGFRVGAMLALGLPTDERIDAMLDLIDTISTVVALVLRTGFLYERQERIIQERTRALTEANIALRDINLRFELAAASGQLAVWDWDIPNNTVVWDDRMYQLYGITREAFPNTFEAWINAVHPEDREPALEESRASLSGEKEYDTEFRIILPDGSVRAIKANALVIRDPDGRPLRQIGLNRDVTEGKKAAEERARLEDSVRQSQKMDAIGQLAGGIAHDFNNMLTGILGYASMLKLDFTFGEPHYDAADIIEKTAERAAELTRKLLGFARRGKFLSLPVDVSDIVREVVSLLSRTIEKNIAITQRLAAGDAIILGDPNQIQQVVLNLALNARDAMPDGGELTLETTFEEIDEEFCRLHPGLQPGRHVVITVRDTGCGIPQELRERIFEPFFTTKEQGKGTGMGLAMVYGIIKNHGGHISVYSEPARGSRFQAWLPSHESARNRAPQQAASRPQKGSGRILLVDDEDVIRKTAGAMLRSLGYDVTLAAGGCEAAELCRLQQPPFDLAIIDMIMPGMDGQETFLALRAIHPGFKTLLSSGYGIDGRAQAILDQGMRGFVQKPYKLADLSDAVKIALTSE